MIKLYYKIMWVIFMNNIFLNVDIDSIATTKKLMESEYDKLLNEFNNYKTMIEETKNIYDTDSATNYRKMGSLYLAIAIKYLNNNVKPYIDSLDDIKQIYLDTHNILSKSINRGE